MTARIQLLIALIALDASCNDRQMYAQLPRDDNGGIDCYSDSEVDDDLWLSDQVATTGEFLQRISEETWLSLEIRESKAAFELHDNSGVRIDGTADVKINNGRISFHWTRASIPVHLLVEEMLIVQDQDGIFLIPEREIHGFCINRKTGTSRNNYVVKDQPQKSLLPRQICFPKEFEKYISMPPIKARVVQANEAELYRHGNSVWGVQSLTIDRGAKDGLLVGSKLYSDSTTRRELTVTSVSENSANAQLESIFSKKHGFVQISLSEHFTSDRHTLEISIFRSGTWPIQDDTEKISSENRRGKIFPKN